MIPATKATGAQAQYFRGEAELLLPILKAFVLCTCPSGNSNMCIIDKTPTHALFIQHFISLAQRFSNFSEVGTTFISQNVLRTTLLLGLSNSLGLP